MPASSDVPHQAEVTALSAGSGVASTLRERWAGAVPSVAVAFSDATTDEALSAFAAQGLDVAEIRIDQFSSVAVDHVVDHVHRFVAVRPRTATLATIRSQGEGGAWGGSDRDRLALFERVLPLVDAVDVEWSSTAICAPVVAAARAQDKLAVVSRHDFDRTPSVEELEATAGAAREVGADYVKVAAWATSPGDLRTLAAFTVAQAETGVIVVAMGDHGPASRVLLPLIGSALTYASASQSQAMAPGQMSFQETFALLRRFSPGYAASHPVDDDEVGLP